MEEFNRRYISFKLGNHDGNVTHTASEAGLPRINNIDASHLTLDILKRRGDSSSVEERQRLRDQAEHHAAENAGPKLIAASCALDRLIQIVAEIGGDARKEADTLLRRATTTVVGVSFCLAVLVLILPAERR